MSDLNVRLEQLTVSHDLSNYLEMVNDKINTHSIEGVDDKIMKKEDLIKFIRSYKGILYGIYNENNIWKYYTIYIINNYFVCSILMQ